MKNLLLLFASILFISSCGENGEEPIKEEVDFTFDYTFVESGSMSRATGGELYSTFYNNYIKTKILTPTTYSLTFTNKETGATATLRGLWSKKDGLKLLEGQYEVIGYSRPTPSYNKAAMDTLSIAFNETVEITKNKSSITLSAIHDSYMLIFDNSNIKTIQYQNSQNKSSGFQERYNLSSLDNIYFMFIKEFFGRSNNSIEFKRPSSELISTVYLDLMPFEKGKYYYFSDMTNSFEIPPMTDGD